MKNTIQKSLNKALSYDAFRGLVSKLVLENKSTGYIQTDALSNYSMLNDKRMKRLDKTIKITQETVNAMSEINKDLIFLVLMESWCGDGAQTLPIINKISKLSPKIEFKIVLRDENDDLMQHFLTNGGKAIPKLIIIEKETLNVVSDWGSRPSVATNMVNDYKEKNGSLDAEFKKNLQIWYNKDKGITTQNDIVSLLNTFKYAN